LSALLAVRVKPRSAWPGIGGWLPGADGRAELEVRVAAAPTDGAANAEVIALLAEALGVSRSELAIVAGAGARHKRLATPFDADELRRRLGGP
jgi:uncharacterized protein YggU (UPF0235/DUF167 family)